MSREWIAHNVRTRRAALGWTQEQLAERAGMPVRRVRTVEQRAHRPDAAVNVKALAALAGVFGCTVDELLRQPAEPQTDYPGPGPVVPRKGKTSAKTSDSV